MTGLTIEVGRGEEETAFMPRTWLLGLQPLPWSEVKFLGLTTWNDPGNKRDHKLIEYKLLQPGNFGG